MVGSVAPGEATRIVRTKPDGQRLGAEKGIDLITALDEILTRMGAVRHKSRTLLRRIRSWDDQ
ncbi:hypothetical protein [Paractinoplanes brasiliensis]|uniref:hypothetical protein n=1 Tax=Paractinoplanes brasiliensis TaxID=52695 RepID=UPI00105B283E|nr:hypothetical protein [Actinoplanes brasiliensis]GID30435.1 hypothetical protein Abr02nite_54180 [Actinoplanes brasiliensis]